MSKKHRWPRFLLSSYWGCWEVDEGGVKNIHKGYGLYYGITWSKDVLYIGYRGSQGHNIPEIVLLDKDYNEIGKAPGQYNEIHQILYVQDKLYVTATMDNAVDVVEGDKRYRVNWTDVDYDRDHINSLHWDGENFWACYHNLCGKKGPEVRSKVVRLDKELSRVEEEFSVGKNIHNVFVDDKYLYTCGSSSGSLIRMDRKTGEEKRAYLGDWVRGLAVTDDYLLVGSSIKGPRELRLGGDLKAHLIDRKTMEVVDERMFEDFGAVFSIRIIGERDYAHTETPCPSVK